MKNTRDHIKNAVGILEKGETRFTMFDGRDVKEGEMYIKVDIRHIVDLAFRIPRLPHFFNP